MANKLFHQNKTASVGRENDYRDEYLFGKNQDKAGGTNIGMISWQRYTKGLNGSILFFMLDINLHIVVL